MAADDNGDQVINLGIEQELRFIVHEEAEGRGACLTLMSGFAEVLGTDVIPNKQYYFPNSSSVSVFTWKGCCVKLNGRLESMDIKSEPWIMVTLNMHACLHDRRINAEHQNTIGPISLVVGPNDVGKTSFCYTLLNYAAKMDKKPVFVDLDVGQNSVSMPGSICVLPIIKPSDVTDGFDQQSLSIYHFGHKSPGFNPKLYFLFLKMLGPAIKNRMSKADLNTKSSGVIIDTSGWVRGDGYRAIVLAAESFQIDVIFVLEDERLYLQLKEDMPASVAVVFVPKYSGVFTRSQYLRSENRKKRVREYFCNPRRNQFSIEVSFADINIYTVNPLRPESDIDTDNLSINDISVVSVPFGPDLEKSILGISYAEKVDMNLIFTNIMGFVCVTKVDMIKKVITLLSPQPGPLPSKICILGQMTFQDPTETFEPKT